MDRPSSVLLIERDDDNRAMYAEYLRFRGLTLSTADTTDDGLVRSASADFIVTGIRVPGSFDGFELIRRLREFSSKTPIIVLTACAFETDRRRAFGAGCDRFLSMPCLPDQLEREIRRLWALRGVEHPPPARAQRPTNTRKPRAS
jgi:CheY-like chemotaxis protein